MLCNYSLAKNNNPHVNNPISDNRDDGRLNYEVALERSYKLYITSVTKHLIFFCNICIKIDESEPPGLSELDILTEFSATSLNLPKSYIAAI